MDYSTLKISYSDESYTDEFLSVSQDDFGSSSVDLKDLVQMLNLTKAGISSRKYLYEVCPYASINDDVLTVILNIYVDVSSLDLSHTISSSQGFLSDKSIVTNPTSFDLIFDHTDTAKFSSLFEGTATNEMPFYNDYGEEIVPEVTMLEHKVNLSESASTVLRCSGTSTGYKYTITLTLDSTPVDVVDYYTHLPTGETVPGYALENLDTTITVKWSDRNGVENTEELELQIPPCVEDLLNICGDGNKLASVVLINSGESNYVVYYSTCTGKVIQKGWRTISDD